MKSTLQIGIAVLLLLVGTASFRTSRDGYKVGQKAEDFRLKNVDGKMVSLKDYKNVKGFLVIFTCNHCPVAKAYEQRIIDLNNKYASQGYPVIAISPNNPEVFADDSFEAMQVRAKKRNYSFPYLLDEGQKVYPKFGATKTPHVFLLSKDLEVKYIGAIDDNSQDASAVKVKYVENAIAALEKGAAPDPAETRAVGCGIK